MFKYLFGKPRDEILELLSQPIDKYNIPWYSLNTLHYTKNDVTNFVFDLNEGYLNINILYSEEERKRYNYIYRTVKDFTKITLRYSELILVKRVLNKINTQQKEKEEQAKLLHKRNVLALAFGKVIEKQLV